MKGAGGLAIAAGIGMALVSGAQAQRENPTGSRVGRPTPADIPDTAAMSTEDQARATMDAYARCVVLTSPRKLEAALSYPASDSNGRNPMAAIATNDCLRIGQLKFPALIMRGALFKAMYRETYRNDQRPLAATAPDFAKRLTETASGNAQMILALDDFADCVVRTKPAESRRLVLSMVAEPAERAALAALTPAMGPCLSSGMEVKFTKSIVIGAIAEALYREAQEPRVTPAASGTP